MSSDTRSIADRLYPSGDARLPDNIQIVGDAAWIKAPIGEGWHRVTEDMAAKIARERRLYK